MVAIGEKTVDYNEDFALYLCTRRLDLEIPPDARAILSEVNFTTTRAGLTSQVSLVNILHQRGFVFLLFGHEYYLCQYASFLR